MISTVHHAAAGDIRLVSSPIKLSGRHDIEYTPPPTLGQHCEAILMQELGFSRAQIEALRAEDVIAG